jgi:hypothetical protein
MPWQSELADDEHVEGHTERGCHLEADRHAPAWQRQYDDIRSARVFAQLSGEPAPGVAPVSET